MEKMTPEEAAQDWANRLEVAPGAMVSDLELMVSHDTGCTGPRAHAAVLDVTEPTTGGGWQLKGRRALAVAILREGLARSGRSRAEIDAEVGRLVARP
jgi:hypothetical protein